MSRNRMLNSQPRRGARFPWLAALLVCGACTGGTFDNGPALRTDARRSAGNMIVGTLCDDRYLCPKDAAGTAPRCATARQNDTVGFCAPSCQTDSDCDAALPGLSVCSSMGGGANECLLFCDRQRLNTSKECPENWTCEVVQTYYLCVPPQTRLPTPDM